jgi:hypothetical protein
MATYLRFPCQRGFASFASLVVALDGGESLDNEAVPLLVQGWLHIFQYCFESIALFGYVSVNIVPNCPLTTWHEKTIISLGLGVDPLKHARMTFEMLSEKEHRRWLRHPNGT